MALRLGVRVREIESWPMSELADWLEYNRKSPISDDRGDYHAALVASCAIRAAGGKTTPGDLMPQWGREAVDMTEEEIRAVAEGLKKQVERYG